jgi:ferredoxin
MLEITFTDQGARVSLAPGTALLDEVERRGLVPIGCAVGNCAACAITVLEGRAHLNAPTPHERYTLTDDELADGARLGCQVVVIGAGSARVRSFWG